MKRDLGGQRFETEDALKDAVETILRNLDGEFYSAGIEKLVQRLNKSSNRFGDYIEK